MDIKRYKVSDVADVIVGFPFKSEFFNTVGNGVRLVRGMNVSEKYLRFGEESRWWSDITDDLQPYYLNENDILIGMDGSKVGKNFALVDKDDLPLLLVQRVACVRAKTNTDQNFLWYCIASDKFVDYVNLIKTGSSIPHISGGQIKNFPVFLPLLSDQKKIAHVLSALDRKIALNKKINQTLEAMAKQLYDYWFVQFDFPNAEGKPYKSSGGKMVWNETLKREIPEGWEAVNIFDAVDVRYGFPFATELFAEEATTVPIVRIRDILEGTISAYSKEETDDKYKLREGDLLVGMDGNFHMNYWHDNIAYLNQRCVRFRMEKESTISAIQTYHNIKPYIKAKEQNAKGSTVGHLSDKDLKGLYVLKATSTKEFSPREFFDNILSHIIKNKQQLLSLTMQRDFLLPLLMNGQVSIK